MFALIASEHGGALQQYAIYDWSKHMPVHNKQYTQPWNGVILWETLKVLGVLRHSSYVFAGCHTRHAAQREIGRVVGLAFDGCVWRVASTSRCWNVRYIPVNAGVVRALQASSVSCGRRYACRRRASVERGWVELLVTSWCLLRLWIRDLHLRFVSARPAVPEANSPNSRPKPTVEQSTFLLHTVRTRGRGRKTGPIV